MSRYFLLQDTKKCIGCHSCEIVCKSNKGTARRAQAVPSGAGRSRIGQRTAKGRIYFHALLSLRNPMVRGRLPHGSHAAKKQ